MIQPANRVTEIQEYYFSRKLKEVAKLNAEGQDIISLAIGSPDMPPSKQTIDTLCEVAHNPAAHGYQPTVGIPELRKAMAGYYKRWYDVDLDWATEIQPLIGSKEGILHVTLAFCNPGDEVLIPNPGYPTYTAINKILGTKITYYDLREDNEWQPDFEALEKMDLSHVKLMWTNYPNMPTGGVAKMETYERLVKFAKDHNIVVVNDNPYSLILNEHPLSIMQVPGAKDCCIEFNSLSKSHNMPGWRVAMISSNKQFISWILKVKSNIDNGSFRGIQLAAKGCHMFRAGVWKPRTKPGGFEGNGEAALPWMKQVKEETGMLTATEVATPEHVELALKYGIDILWVGARTSANPFAMQALADSLQGVDVPVLVKNPVNPDLELWIGALQRINQAGIKRLGAIHRGFSSFDKKIYRNLPMWQIPIELHRRIPQLPIICDPSHIGGRRDLIAPLCQQAMDLGFDGLIVESHCSPDDAWSDAKQQVTPDILDYILSLLVVRDEHYSTEGLHQLRGQIDECDNQLMDLLAKRMRVCREIGTYKKEHNMTIVQTNRYNEILEKRGAQASLCGMSPEFAAQIFEHIHEESVRQQLEILNQK